MFANRSDEVQRNSIKVFGEDVSHWVRSKRSKITDSIIAENGMNFSNFFCVRWHKWGNKLRHNWWWSSASTESLPPCYFIYIRFIENVYDKRMSGRDRNWLVSQYFRQHRPWNESRLVSSPFESDNDSSIFGDLMLCKLQHIVQAIETIAKHKSLTCSKYSNLSRGKASKRFWSDKSVFASWTVELS